MRDWIVNHPFSNQSLNVVLWIGLVGLILSMIVNKLK